MSTEAKIGQYTAERKVRFQHVDAAGIAFYPRYFEMINSVVEDWFDECLGMSFGYLHSETFHGVPTVSACAEFPRPSRLGDKLIFTLSVERIGRSSISLGVSATCANEERLSARVVLVYTDRRRFKADRIPAALREKLAQYCGG